MGYDPRIDHRRSVRLPSYDYAQPGAYFVTICTYRRECPFDTRIQQVLRRIWARTTGHGCYPNDGEFVAMPNHIHGIVWISARQTTGLGATVGASRPPIRGTASPPDCVWSSDGSLASVDGSPLHSESARTFAHAQRGGLRDLVASFKTTAALAVNKSAARPAHGYGNAAITTTSSGANRTFAACGNTFAITRGNGPRIRTIRSTSAGHSRHPVSWRSAPQPAVCSGPFSGV
jgi:hypothetical protein